MSNIRQQFRDFGSTFAVLGLSPSYPGAAYGLAEHVVGVCARESNLAGLELSDIEDEDLECVGDVDKLSEGSKVGSTNISLLGVSYEFSRRLYIPRT